MWPKRPFYKGLLNKGKSRQSLINSRGQYRVRKRETLEEDSSLGLKGINISYINLGRLISRKSCTITCTLFHNKYQVLTSALADSRVNAFTLIDI
jgi:predicted NUDIX family phosphoesterase